MSRVLTYEDQQFTQNANKIQQQIDAYGSMDVVRPQDKQYLNGKMNDLVNGINNLGGVNLADPSIANQIQGLGAGIYSDPKIINAVSGTRAFRNLQGQYQQWLTDPKFKGQYSKVNEAYDMNQASNWFNNKEVGAQYTGPTSATPYTDIDKMANDAFKKLKGNYTESTVQSGYYIRKDGSETLSEKELAQRARDLVLNNPQSAEQAKRNSWFLTEGMGYSPDQVVGGLINTTNNDVADTQADIDYYQKMKDLSANDPKAYEQYDRNLNRLIEYQKQLKDKATDLQQNGLSNYQKNPSSFQMDYYMGNWSRGIGRIYQINRQTSDLKPDAAAMLQQTIQQKNFHDEGMLAEHGIRRFYDPSIGGYNYYRDPSLAPLKGSVNANGVPIGKDNVFEPLNDVAPDLEKAYRVDLDTTIKKLNDINAQKDNILNNYLGELGKSDDNLSFLNKPGQQRDNYIKNLKQMYEDKSLGKQVDLSKLPDGAQQVFSQLDELNNESSFEQRRVNTANSYIAKKANLTEAEQQLLTQYQLNPEKYSTKVDTYNGALMPLTGLIPQMMATLPNEQVRNILQKIDKSVSPTDKKEYWSQFSKRPQYFIRNYSDEDQKYLGDLKSDIVLNKALNDPELQGIPTENLRILGIGRRNNGEQGYGEYVEILDKNGKKTTASTKMIPISDETAQSYIGQLPDVTLQNVAQEVQFEGKSQPRTITSLTPNGISAKVIVVKVVGSNAYKAQVVTSSGNKIPITQPQSSPELAFQQAREIIQKYKDTDYNGFIAGAQSSKYLQ
jgi:hypothetical protein